MEKIPPGEHLSPFETQRKVHELFAQETRHHILQTILGHPTQLPSLAELSYYSQKSEATVLDQLGELAEYGMVTTYTLDSSTESRDLPGTFYGLTERGVLMLEKFNYVQGASLLQSIHEQTAKTERIRRHESAPRPSLPERVEGMLAGAEGASETGTDSELAAAFAAAVSEGDSSKLRDVF